MHHNQIRTPLRQLSILLKEEGLLSDDSDPPESPSVDHSGVCLHDVTERVNFHSMQYSFWYLHAGMLKSNLDASSF